MTHRKIVGENIRTVRREKGLTQEELAWSAKINSKYLSTVELGQENISLDTLVKISKVLGVPLERLVKGVPWE